jgi:hypothetical protein
MLVSGGRTSRSVTSECDSSGYAKRRQKTAARKAQLFNRLYPIGTRVEVHPFLDSDDRARCTVVRPPGAFVLPSHDCVVKVPGDAYAIEAVFPICEVKYG